MQQTQSFDEIEAGLRAELAVARSEVAHLDHIASDYTVKLEREAAEQAALGRERAANAVKVVQSKLDRLASDRVAAARLAEQEAHLQRKHELIANRESHARVIEAMQEHLDQIAILYELAADLDDAARTMLDYGGAMAVLKADGWLVLNGHLSLAPGEKGRLLQRQIEVYLANATSGTWWGPNLWRDDLRGMVRSASRNLIEEWEQFQHARRTASRKVEQPSAAAAKRPDSQPAATTPAALHVGA